MPTLHFSAITIPPIRQREYFKPEALAELAESLASPHGMIHPIALRLDARTLVAGQRRLKAVELLAGQNRPVIFQGESLPIGHIPYTLISSDEEYHLHLAEFQENALREPLTIMEAAKATKRLHDFMIEQHGAYSPRDKPEGWTIGKTVAVVQPDPKAASSTQRTRVNRHLKISEYADDPIISAAATESEALKLIKQRESAAIRTAAAAVADISLSPHRITFGDFYEQPILPHPCACAIIDPPYGLNIHLDAKRDKTYHDYDDSPEALDRFLTEGLTLVSQSLSPASHIYIFCDILNWQKVADALFLCGFTTVRRPLIWYKGNTGSFVNSDYEPRHVYEAIVYGWRGDKKPLVFKTNVLDYPNPIQQFHAAGKPQALLKDLIDRSCLPGDMLYAPMCGGSGNIFRAASAARVSVIANELSKPSYENCIVTLQELLISP